MPCEVVIVDYRTGNLSSVKRGIERAGGEARISGEISDIQNCDKLVLAGVGHFDTALDGIRELKLEDALNQAVLADKKPVLGICLGLELMAEKSEEGSGRGLGWIKGVVVRFKIANRQMYKVPHIGWNTLDHRKASSFLRNISDSSEFYFNHSFYFSPPDAQYTLTETEYESNFVSAIEKDNIFGVQFHPEKSLENGLQLLRNFIEI